MFFDRQFREDFLRFGFGGALHFENCDGLSRRRPELSGNVRAIDATTFRDRRLEIEFHARF